MAKLQHKNPEYSVLNKHEATVLLRFRFPKNRHSKKTHVSRWTSKKRRIKPSSLLMLSLNSNGDGIKYVRQREKSSWRETENGNGMLSSAEWCFCWLMNLLSVRFAQARDGKKLEKRNIFSVVLHIFSDLVLLVAAIFAKLLRSTWQWSRWFVTLSHTHTIVFFLPIPRHFPLQCINTFILSKRFTNQNKSEIMHEFWIFSVALTRILRSKI